MLIDAAEVDQHRITSLQLILRLRGNAQLVRAEDQMLDVAAACADARSKRAHNIAELTTGLRQGFGCGLLADLRSAGYAPDLFGACSDSAPSGPMITWYRKRCSRPCGANGIKSSTLTTKLFAPTIRVSLHDRVGPTVLARIAAVLS